MGRSIQKRSPSRTTDGETPPLHDARVITANRMMRFTLFLFVAPLESLWAGRRWRFA